MFTPITITGLFTKPDGSVSQGSGTATLSHRLINGTTVIEPQPISGQLNASGHWVNTSGGAYILEATDDPGTEPAGAVYEFVLEIDGAPIDPFQAVISHTAPAGTVDLSALIPSLP